MSQFLRAYMNGVVVGELSRDQYESLRNDALKDGLTHLRQGVFIFGALTNIALKLIYIIPLLAFWAAVYLAMSEPDTLRQVTAFAQANPEQFARKLLSLTIWGPIYLMLVGFLAAAGQWKALGFRNLFGEEINAAIRRELEIAAEGDITVARTVVTSEMETHPKLVLDLPAEMVLSYAMVSIILLLLHHELVALATALISHGALHYLYRNGKLDGILSRVGELRQRWKKRGQGKR